MKRFSIHHTSASIVSFAHIVSPLQFSPNMLMYAIVSDWSKRGGIVGRGVLLDYVAFAARHNVSYDPMTRHCISLSDIQKMAHEQSLRFQHGDILIIRTGWVKWYEENNEQERRAKIKNGNDHVGIEGNEEVFAWLWNNHFAAIASDTVGVEAWPPTFPWCKCLLPHCGSTY